MLYPRSRFNGSRRGVVVTGLGLVTALGTGRADNAAGFKKGIPAFRPVTLFDTSKQRAKIAAEAIIPTQFPSTNLTAREVSRLDRADRLLIFAATEALSQSGWGLPDSLPIMLGTTSGGMAMGEAFYQHWMTGPRHYWGQPSRAMHYQAHLQGQRLAHALNASGPLWIISNACASSANAIGEAYQLIRNGQFDRVLTGGFDALSQLIFAGFDALQALSPTQCRPFGRHRDGLALGEGAAVLCLEEVISAQQRGADILGEIVGYGAATDIYHLTQPHPEGTAAYDTMVAACVEAGLAAEQIDYVNAHGTGTPLNDSAEAVAINRWAGSRAGIMPVSSTKATIGHLLGAAGAVEAAVCLLALGQQWLPPMTTTVDVDPICGFSIVTEARSAKIEYALSNSFGFGGANATLIFRRWHE